MSGIASKSVGVATSSASVGPPVRTGRHANTTLVVLFLSLGGLAFAVLQSLVAPALPAIAKDLHSSISDVSWVLTAYLLAASVLTPILGRLGDMVGKRRVLLITLFVQVVAVTLLPAALVFLIILLNNEEIMGKYKNTLFENIANITIVVLIIALSTLYGISTVFPNLFG